MLDDAPVGRVRPQEDSAIGQFGRKLERSEHTGGLEVYQTTQNLCDDSIQEQMYVNCNAEPSWSKLTSHD